MLITGVPNSRPMTFRPGKVFGLIVHTTGSGPPTAALDKGTTALAEALAYYLLPNANFAHYVCDYDGIIYRLADEKVKAPHVGFSNERQSYLSGAWVKQLPPSLVKRWRARWPHSKSPAHLFPGPSVNEVYVGLELLPVAKGGPKAMTPGLRYTTAQHDAAADLAKDMAVRHKWPAGWWGTGRLCGHEDVNPITRHNVGGGWDPGALRAKPWFDWDYVIDRIAG